MDSLVTLSADTATSPGNRPALDSPSSGVE